MWRICSNAGKKVKEEGVQRFFTFAYWQKTFSNIVADVSLLFVSTLPTLLLPKSLLLLALGYLTKRS
jgi:hypothetical protein